MTAALPNNKARHRDPVSRSTTAITLPPGTDRSPAVARTAFGSKKKSSILSVTVTAFIVPGLFATVALPAYAFVQPESTAELEASVALNELTESSAQTVKVADAVVAASTARDVFTATSVEELARLAAEARRAELAVQFAAYAGPRASDYLANPPYPSFSLDQVVAVAMQYVGVPYRYGGADPSGFDCSGLVMFVYSQFGVSLPHSSSGQARIGTRISPADALPGDLVVVDGGSHIGIYTGGGNFIDAPYPGRTVQNRSIYTGNHYFVRVGI